jgi:hypothetical protein
MATFSPIPKSPVSNKVSAATVSSGGLGLLIGMVIDFVPWLRNNIPPAAIPLIPGFLAPLGAFVGGYRATHRPTAAEIIAEIASADSLVHTIEGMARLPVQITTTGGTSTTIPGVSTQYPYTRPPEMPPVTPVPDPPVEPPQA